MDKNEPQTCTSHMAMKVKILHHVSCSLVMVLSIAGVVMAGSHEVSQALFITILFLSTCSGAMMIGAKLVRESGNSKYQVRLSSCVYLYTNTKLIMQTNPKKLS